MKTFRSDHPIPSPVTFYYWLIGLSVFILTVIYDICTPGTFVSDQFFVVALAIILAGIYESVTRRKLYEIVIDYDKQAIVLLFTSLSRERKQKILPFKNTSAMINKPGQGSGRYETYTSIYFCNQDIQLLEINTAEDGFSIDRLNEICDEVQKTPMRVFIGLPA